MTSAAPPRRRPAGRALTDPVRGSTASLPQNRTSGKASLGTRIDHHLPHQSSPGHRGEEPSRRRIRPPAGAEPQLSLPLPFVGIGPPPDVIPPRRRFGFVRRIKALECIPDFLPCNRLAASQTARLWSHYSHFRRPPATTPGRAHPVDGPSRLRPREPPSPCGAGRARRGPPSAPGSSPRPRASALRARPPPGMPHRRRGQPRPHHRPGPRSARARRR